MNWTIRIALALTLAASLGSTDAYAHCGKDHADLDGVAHCGDCAGDDGDHEKKSGECESKTGKDGKDAECKDKASKDAKDKASKNAKDEGSCHSKDDKDAA